MSRYIDVEKQIRKYKGNILTAQTDYAQGCRDIIEDFKNAPTADVQKVKHGKWLPLKFTLECSECGNSFTERNITIYDKRTDTLAYAYFCPICGAMMD